MAETTGGAVGGHGEYRSLLDSSVGDSGRRRFGNTAGGHAAAFARARPQDGRRRLPVDSDPAQSWITAKQLSTDRGNQPTANHRAPESGSGKGAGRLGTEDAQVFRPDERQSAPRRQRYARRYRDEDHSRHRQWRAGCQKTGPVERPALSAQ